MIIEAADIVLARDWLVAAIVGVLALFGMILAAIWLTMDAARAKKNQESPDTWGSRLLFTGGSGLAGLVMGCVLAVAGALPGSNGSISEDAMIEAAEEHYAVEVLNVSGRLETRGLESEPDLLIRHEVDQYVEECALEWVGEFDEETGQEAVIVCDRQVVMHDRQGVPEVRTD